MRSVDSDGRGLPKNITDCTTSSAHYFANLGGDGHAGDKALELLNQWFGSYERWDADFKKPQNALAGGSEWVILAHNAHRGELHNYWAWDHMHNAPMSRPLLVLDMYELLSHGFRSSCRQIR